MCLVNFQAELPNIPVDGIEVRLRMPHRVKSIELLPGGKKIAHTEAGGVVKLTVPKLETLAMFAVHSGRD